MHSLLLCRCMPRASLAQQEQSFENAAVRVRNLSHRYGTRQVLRAVDLDIQSGSLHILAGSNGCGKSTLLRVLGGLLSKQHGEIQMVGPVGIVMQNPDHQIILPSVAAEVAFGLGRFNLARRSIEHLVEDALHQVEMLDYANQPTSILSGGQKQRVAIAGALALNPSVLLLDELTTFLDDEGQASVMRAVKAAVQGPRQVTALWITHRLEELQWADRASFMEAGQVKLTGPPSLILKQMS